MSLIVWLPLNGDLRNNGLDDVTVTNNGATVNNNGKTGKCYSFNSGYLNLSSSFMTGFTTECSVCFWLKLNAWNSSYETYFQAGKNNSSWADYIFGILRNGSGSTVCFTIGNGTSASNNSYITSAWSTETWMHVAFVYSTGKCKIYLNGSLDKEYNTSIVPDFTKITKISIGHSNGSGYQTNCLMDDFRIYDHALSLKEVEEISKGLILHYPLADKYIENTTNLITTEDCLSATCFNGAINKYGYGTNTDMYKQVTTFDGRKGTKLYNQTNGTNMYPYVYISNMYTSDGTNAPAYKTLSFDYYTTISTSICPYKLGSGNGTATYIVTNNETKTGIGTNQVVIPVKPNMWNHIEVTFHGTTEADAQWGYIQNQPSHTSDTSNFWFFANMQLEEKDHATGYTGVGGVRNDDVVYDCSGYGNDGTVNGNLVYSTNSPRYALSAIFNGSNNAIKTPDLTTMISDRDYTISCWTYKTVIGSKNYQTIYGGPSGFELEARSGSTESPLFRIHNWGGGTTAYEFGRWYHFCFVHNSENSKLYINGELKITGTSKNNPSGNYFIGAWRSATEQNYDGLISDFRIYATALSADQILELYQTTASIDKNNNFYSYSYNELNQGNEIEYLYDLNKSSGTGNFYQDKDGLHLDQGIWVYHDYIPIDPTDKTYKYDIELSCDTGNLFYIGWERYDTDKTSRSNNACTYVYASSAERNHYRIRGTVNLSTDGVNPCAFIRLRILNKWTGSDSETNGTATIHYLSLKEYSDTTVQNMTPLNINKQGVVNTTEILEKDIGVSVSNVYELNSHNFYEY